LFDQAPPSLPINLDWRRVEGMMLGLAIGDSLGNTTEGLLPHERRELYGEIRDYLPNEHANGLRAGVPSDDTQMAFWTLEQLMADGGLEPDHLAERFCAQRIFGIGSAVDQFRKRYRAGTRPWHACAADSAGNGALMRIAPILIPHLRTGTSALWADAAVAATLTHKQAASTSACVAWVSILWKLLGMESPPEPRWWIDAYVGVARQLEGDRVLHLRGGDYDGFHGPLWRFVEEHVWDAYERGLSTLDAANGWYSAAFVLETVSCALYILMRHGDDPEEALVRAANDTKDSDTVAAIVGAAIGALHGTARLPRRWVDGLTGRTGAHDDGCIFGLLSDARRVFFA
jgi:ADP-ribosylglycohydrolase